MMPTQISFLFDQVSLPRFNGWQRRSTATYITVVRQGVMHASGQAFDGMFLPVIGQVSNSRPLHVDLAPTQADYRSTWTVILLFYSLTLWLIIGALVCIGDGCYNTLRTAVLTKMYDRSDSSQAFAISKFFQVPKKSRNHHLIFEKIHQFFKKYQISFF